MTETIDNGVTEAELVDGYAEGDAVGTALVPAASSAPTVTPQVGAAELVARLATIREAMETAMTPNVDYGVIPGTNKPTLLKPGAEKLSALFQLDVQIVNEKLWESPHLTVISHATVYHAPSATRLGYGEGICTTREKKYAKRRAELVCPECGKANVRKSKQSGEGWYCWRKTDGCGATFPEGDDRIASQKAGDVENPDLPDTWNTVVKMAEKRARVDAVLAVTGASALFTQDAEDLPQAAASGAPASPPAEAAPSVTAEDVEAIKAAAKGLTNKQIALAFGSLGLDATKPFGTIPQAKAAELTTTLAGVERAS